MVRKLLEHIKAQGYHVTDREPDQAVRMTHPQIVRVRRTEGGYPAYRTPMDDPMALAAAAALRRTSDRQPVLLPSLGGSLPLHLFGDLLQVPIIGVPIANHDNNQHQPDENLRIGHLWTGIETYAALIMLDSTTR
jgi:acetylornithine deacetylase/succinyl-diaminopimelate desuccinylase-like protein